MSPYSPDMVVHTFNPSTPGAGRFLSVLGKPGLSSQRVPGQMGLRRATERNPASKQVISFNNG